MDWARPPMRRTVLATVAVLAVASSIATVDLAGASSSEPSSRGGRVSGGSVAVLYAGSLVRLMESGIGPAFTRATGYRFVGYSGGSKELASEVKGGIERGDVFVSASPSVDQSLEGKANGSWVSWYVDFGRSNLVLGFNRRSRFATALRSRPWYRVITSPGFLLGRTDPTIDPKGALVVEALRDEARRTGDAALLSITKSTKGVFPEETLLGRLQAGQLDAGFFYLVEAKAAGLPTVSLAPVALSATFTVTILDRAPDAKGALAFVRFLLGKRPRSILEDNGFTLTTPPVLFGSNAPSSVREVTTRS